MNWKLGGEAGFGVLSAGEVFARSLTRSGFNVFASDEHPSLVRGGHNTIQVRFSEEEIHCHEREIDLLIALDEKTAQLHVNELKSEGGIVYDSSQFILSHDSLKRADVKLYDVPMAEIIKELKAPIIVRNTVSLGSSMAYFGIEMKNLESVIKDSFEEQKISDLNIEAARRGYEYFKENFKLVSFFITKKGDDTPKMLLTGNDATCLGAIKAGCKFLSAYPMTPASSILHYLAAKAEKNNMITIQSEDEISAIGNAIGAAFAGVRAMTATSGGGFSLMTEFISLTAMTETPLVIVEVQRPGPSTGLATRHGQGDLDFVLSAGQGEFPRIVLAPGDIDECFYLTFEAFNLAERFQVPVIVLSDKYLGTSHKSTSLFNTNLKIDRGYLLTRDELEKIDDFKRYEYTETGVSPRSLPGQRNGIHNAPGNEHDEYGDSMEDAYKTTQIVDKRFRKLPHILSSFPNQNVFGSSISDVSIVSWGSTKGAILEAMDMLDKDGVSSNFLQVTHLSPFPATFVSEFIEKSQRIMSIEVNKTGQLANLIAKETGYIIDMRVSKYNGRPITPKEVYRGIKALLGGE
jgi:2-oxoglutarate ferredoxin oxidoreductase subunit alpha